MRRLQSLWMSWDVDRADAVLGLLVKGAAIVAAVAALNLFNLDPHLSLAVQCTSVVDPAKIDVPSGPGAVVLTGIHGQLQQHHVLARTESAGACPSPPKATVAETKQRRNREKIQLNVAGVSSVSTLYSAHDAAHVFEEYRRFARDLNKQVAASVGVVVSNLGPGAASNIRLEVPPAYLPNGERRSFDLSASEQSSRFVFRTKPGAAAQVAGTPFRVFGDAVPTINSRALWIVAAIVFVVIALALPAKRRREPEEEKGVTESIRQPS